MVKRLLGLGEYRGVPDDDSVGRFAVFEVSIDGCSTVRLDCASDRIVEFREVGLEDASGDLDADDALLGGIVDAFDRRKPQLAVNAGLFGLFVGAVEDLPARHFSEVVAKSSEQSVVVEARGSNGFDRCERVFAGEIDVAALRETIRDLSGDSLAWSFNGLLMEFGREPRNLIFGDVEPVDPRHGWKFTS